MAARRRLALSSAMRCHWVREGCPGQLYGCPVGESIGAHFRSGLSPVDRAMPAIGQLTLQPRTKRPYRSDSSLGQKRTLNYFRLALVIVGRYEDVLRNQSHQPE